MLLGLWAKPLSAQPESCTDPKSDCQIVVKKGDTVPMDGVLLSAPRAASVAAKLDQCLAPLESETKHSARLVDIERSTCDRKVKIIMDTALEREALLHGQVMREQNRTKEVAAEAAQAEAEQLVWAFGGAAVGLLVGAVVGGALVLYLQNQQP